VTPKQKELYDWWSEQQKVNHYPPSMEEAAAHFGVYPNAVNDKIQNLVKGGHMKRVGGGKKAKCYLAL
jgi:predicted transcriptional regulator